jgi:hypothetical protein
VAARSWTGSSPRSRTPWDSAAAPAASAAPPSGSLRVEGRHAAEEAWLRERLARDGDPVEISDFLRLLKKTGNVHLSGCRLAAATFEVDEANLIPEADAVVDSVWFLNEKAARADHCQYF